MKSQDIFMVKRRVKIFFIGIITEFKKCNPGEAPDALAKTREGFIGPGREFLVYFRARARNRRFIFFAWFYAGGMAQKKRTGSEAAKERAPAPPGKRSGGAFR